MQPVDVSSFQASSQAELKPNAKVGFIVINSVISGTTLTRDVKLYTDYEEAMSAMEKLSGFSRMNLAIAQDGAASEEISLHGSSVPKKVKKTITDIRLIGEHFNHDKLIVHLAKRYRNIKALYVESLTREGCTQLHLFKKLSTLEINNSSLKKALKRSSLFAPSYKSSDFFSDASLQTLEKCQKLTALTLTKVKTKPSSVRALRTKMPFLKKESPKKEKSFLPPARADAAVSFYIEKHKFNNGKVTVVSKVSRCYEDACADADTTQLRLQTRLETESSTHCFDTIKDFKRTIDLLQIRSAIVEGDLAFFDIMKVAKNLKDAPNLRELTLHNATRKTLVCFKELSQLHTLTIDNTSLNKSITKILQSDDLSTEDTTPIDDEIFCEVVGEMTHLTKVHLIGCEHISKAFVKDVIGKRNSALTVKIVAEPKEKTAKKKPQDAQQKRDGKDEKEAFQVSRAMVATEKAAPNRTKTQKEKSSFEERNDCYHLINANYNKYPTDYEQALERCEEYLEMINGDPEAEHDDRHFQIKAHVLYVLSSCHFALGKVSDETKGHLEMAIKLFSKFTEQHVKGKLWLLYGDYLTTVNDYVHAADAYSKAQKMKLDDTLLEAKSHYDLGLCLQKTKGSIDKIREEFKQAYRLINSNRYRGNKNCLTNIEKSLKEAGITVVKEKNRLKFLENEV
jgi:tetratricopeptide (TPR) repeat protein